MGLEVLIQSTEQNMVKMTLVDGPSQVADGSLDKEN